MADPVDNAHVPETPEDGLVASADHPIRLPVFEGPLDLLLYLIRKNEIDIHDIPIGVVTKQYLAVLRSYEKMNLDVAGEFFVMAATLMYIKSRMLLPPEKIAAESEDDDGIDEDENLDPRWQLVRQLIQYKRIKETAGHLSALIELRQGFVSRVVPPPTDSDVDRPVANADRLEVWNTFNNILRRLSEKVMPGEIYAETVTITTRMEDILARLGSEKNFTFTSLLPERPTIPLLVATFLACLELARLGKLLLVQTENFDDILCAERPADDPLKLGEDLPPEEEKLHSEDDLPEDGSIEDDFTGEDAEDDDISGDELDASQDELEEDESGEDAGDDLEEIEEDETPDDEEKPGA